MFLHFIYCIFNLIKQTVFFLAQDRSRADKSKNRRCGYYISTEEPEYDVVDDHEDVLNVCIFPARPINEEREYAGREENKDAYFNSSLFYLDFSV